MGEDDIINAKFIVAEEGEFGLVITSDRKLRIIDVANEETREYDSEFVDELIQFLEENW
jgi:hypothetical protein